MSRSRTPIQEGASKRLQRMRLFLHIVQLSMPEGIDRNEAVSAYCVQTGLTLRKAEEHANLLEDTGMLRWDDLRFYTTDKGLRWAGYARNPEGQLLNPSEKAEEEYRSRTRTNAQKAPLDERGSRDKRTPSSTTTEDGKTRP